MLKSDYFRIEMKTVDNWFDAFIELKSDYFRIEIDGNIITIAPTSRVKIRLF